MNATMEQGDIRMSFLISKSMIIRKEDTVFDRQ